MRHGDGGRKEYCWCSRLVGDVACWCVACCRVLPCAAVCCPAPRMYALAGLAMVGDAMNMRPASRLQQRRT